MAGNSHNATVSIVPLGLADNCQLIAVATVADAIDLNVIRQRIPRGIDTNEHTLVIAEVIDTISRESIQPEIAVTAAFPAPIDAEFAAIKAVNDKRVTANLTITAVQDGAMGGKLFQHQIHPIVVAVIVTVQLARTGIVAEVGYSRHLVPAARTAAIDAITHP